MAPTTSRMASVSSTPSPRMLFSYSQRCQAPGSTQSVWSSVSMIHFSTARVMNSGTITSKPENNHLRKASMAADQSLLAGAGAGAGAAGAGLGAAVGEDAAGAESAGLAPSPEAGAVAGSDFLPPPSRKSVTYQPEPLSWKPAAVTCFSNALAPHAGHTFRGASDIFCKASLAKPQALHL